MSDYKEVNGKKYRICKYTCGMQLTWNEKANSFVEEDGTLHNKDRCQQVKDSKQQPKQTPATSNNNNSDISLEVVLKKLASIGITLDLEKLRNCK